MKKKLTTLATIIGVLAPIIVPKVKAKIKNSNLQKQERSHKSDSRRSDIFD